MHAVSPRGPRTSTASRSSEPEELDTRSASDESCTSTRAARSADARRSASFPASKAHSRASNTASILSASKSRTISSGAGASGAPIRSQKVWNCAAVTFERVRAIA